MAELGIQPTLDEAPVAGDGHPGARYRLLTRPVVLVGFMGVGKSSVARELAALLGRPLVDTDAMVEQAAGCTIGELFAQGEEVFRAREREAVAAALAGPPSVIALGGGAFSQPGAAEVLLARALVVNLYMPWRVLREMVPDLAVKRPLLRDRPIWEVQDLFLARTASYRRAHLRVVLPRRDSAGAAHALAGMLTGGCVPQAAVPPEPAEPAEPAEPGGEPA